MSDLPSINDLVDNGEEKKDEVQSSNLNVATPEVEEKFEKKMSQVKIKEKETEATRLAGNLKMPHIDLEKFPITQEALKQVSKEEARKLKAVCFYATPDEVRLGVVKPGEEVTELLHQVEERKHAHGSLYIISENSLKRVLKLYDTLPVVEAVTKDVNIDEKDLEKVQADVTNFESFQALLDKKSTTDLVTLLLGVGLKMEASDVHVEAEEEKIVARLRLDGVLHDAATLSKDIFKQLISRIKLLASLKINITDKPQDGRFTIKLSDTSIDVRVSTIPTVYGESVVMRLLDQSRKGLDFDKLGLYGDAYEKLKQEMERPNGMIITTGPTGSGKTTTLYAILEILNKPGVKIITLEDPVEYKMEGINQSQIDRSKEYTFAGGLRSLLRQDPDIVMVGEIRDLETADVAIQASLTGHLLFSTIHTNNAAGAIPRFLSMGVKPFLLAPALNAIMGQRLVRRICEKCKQKVELTDREKKLVDGIIQGMPDKEKGETEGKELLFYKGSGCDECGGIGYKGRVGIYEILRMTPEIEKMVLSNKVSEHEIEQAAIANGMVTMVQDGVIKSLEGVTSLEEVFRVTE